MLTSLSPVTFDRAVPFFDETRGLPSHVHKQVVDMLAMRLDGASQVLEMGAGRGRFAIPLATAGIPITGIDISLPMIAKLLEDQDTKHRVKVIRADAVALPFADGSFDATFACHVLHLITDWRCAVEEMVRVVRPGGQVLFDLGHGSSEQRDFDNWITARFGDARKGVTECADVDELLSSLGGKRVDIPEFTFESVRSPATFIDRVLADRYSFTWSLNADQRQQLGNELKVWAEARYGDIDSTISMHTTVVWRGYEF
ncbi:MAG: class I SAM-dependent methyltransferase [Actinomycetota bacterium]|nr:class I SAM-dependent methyltransferase [Actinomycetota bacterium]